MPRRALSAFAATALGLMGVAMVAISDAHAGRGDGPPYAAAFDKAFEPGFSVEIRFTQQDKTIVETVTFKIVEAGQLKLPSGRICAADPFVQLSDRPPFTQAVPAGTYPVRLAVGDHPTGGLRTAFARVDFRPAPAVSWKMAVIEGQDPATLKDDEIFGFPVDAGTGSFFDPLVGQAANALLTKDQDASEAWQTEGESNGPKVVGPYYFLLNLPLGEGNAIMFHSGWGDGFYASYFGYDANGEVVTLVTDYATIDWQTSKW